uniref:Plasmid pARN4 n=1 Tax=Saccharolobus islandicus TaxID=43080 RepID=R7RB18_SACIS|nr:unnamed protein product [Sulfolobus islandicus]
MQIFSSDLLTLLNFKLSSFCSFAFCLTFALQIFALFFASATNPLYFLLNYSFTRFSNSVSLTTVL